MANEEKRPADDRNQDSAEESNDSGSEETLKKKRKIDWAKFTSSGDRQESLTGETEQMEIPIRPPKPDEFFR